jgi:Fe-S cluster assembly iron-binding protein IscA
LLRIAFTTGCGGSGYRLSFAGEPIDGDRVIEVQGLRIALDDMAASRLDGAVIQYDEDEDGYLLEHPDAVSAVWCG